MPRETTQLRDVSAWVVAMRSAAGGLGCSSCGEEARRVVDVIDVAESRGAADGVNRHAGLNEWLCFALRCEELVSHCHGDVVVHADFEQCTTGAACAVPEGSVMEVETKEGRVVMGWEPLHEGWGHCSVFLDGEACPVCGAGA